MINRIQLFVLFVLLCCFELFSARHYVTQVGSGNQTGIDWANASDNLINIVPGLIDGDEVWIASGTYYPSLTNTRTDNLTVATSNVMFFGGFAGGETMLSQRDHVANPTVISGNIGSGTDTDNSQTIFQINAANVMINGLILESGYADGGSQPHNQGGGIYASSSARDLTLENCIFRDHFTNNRGPAIGQPNNVSSGPMLIINCVFEDNSNTGSDGGAIYTKGWTIIESSIFLNNSSADGGAIYFGIGGESGNVNHTTFYNNTASGNGGHIFSGSTDLAIQNSIFWDHISADGNAIYKNSGTTTTYNSLIKGASSTSWPGGTAGSDGGNNIDFDPLFSGNINPPGADMYWFTHDDGLSLTAGSNAIDAGFVTMNTLDILGETRDASPDLGAYEFSLPPDLLLVDDTMFTPPNTIGPGGYEQVMSFDFENQSGNAEVVEKMRFDVLSGNAFDLTYVDIFGGAILEVSGNAYAGNLVGNDLEFYLDSPLFVGAGTNVTFSVNIEVDGAPAENDIQLKLSPSNFYLSGGNVVDGDFINTGVIDFGLGGGSSLTVTDNVNFTIPTNVAPGSVNETVLDYNIFNGTGNVQNIDALDIYVNQGSVSDIAELTLIRDNVVVVSGNATSGNFIGGNVHFDFNPPLYIGVSGNSSYEIELNIEGSPTFSILDLSIAPGDYTVAGGNAITGDTLNTGAMNLTAPSPYLELKDKLGFMPPSSVNEGEVDVVVMEFKLNSGANLELVDELEFVLGGNAMDITQLEIYDVSNNFDLVASANMSDGDGDGLLDYLDPDNMTSAVNMSNGNLFFRGAPLYESIPGSTNTLELKITMAMSTVSDNLEFTLNQDGVKLAGGNMVGGNFVTTGPIFINAGGGGGNVILEGTAFMPPANIPTSSVNTVIMEVELDTTTNGVSSTISEIEFDVIWGDPMNDFTSFELYDETGPSAISASANISNGNILFEGLSFGLSGGANAILSLRGSTPGSFTTDNVQIELHPFNVTLSSDGVSGSFQDSGLILLDNMGAGGNVILVDTPFNPPANIGTSSVNAVIMEVELDTTTNGVSSTVDSVEFDLIWGDPMNDFTSFELYDESTMSTVSSSANISNGNILFDMLSLGLSGGSNTILSLRGTTPGSFTTDNVQIELHPENIYLSSDAVSGMYQDSSLILLDNMGAGGNVILVDTPFNPPANIGTSSVNAVIMEVELDTTTNGVSSTVDSVEFDVIWGDPMNDFTSFELYDESTMSTVSSSANISNGNILFDMLSLGLSGGSNTILSLRGTTPGTFTTDNVQIELHPENIYLSFDAVSGMYQDSSLILLDNMGGGGGNLVFGLTGFSPPTDLNPNDEAQVLEFAVENTGTSPETLNVLEMHLPQGNAFIDISSSELINLSTGNSIISGSPTSSSNVDFNSLNVVIPGMSNVLLGVNVLIGTVPESATVQFEVDSDTLGFVSGNTIDVPMYANSGPINLGGMSQSGNFTSVAIGAHHALFVNAGELFALGKNDFSALGNVGSAYELLPLKIGSKTDWVQVGVSSGHSVAVDAQGNVYGWGTNDYERLELLSSPVGTPTQLSFGGIAEEIVVSESGTFVLDDMNYFHAIGRNELGQLGIGITTASENVFTQLSGLGNVTSYSVGVDHGLAVVSGNLWAWGSDGFGQLGANTMNYSNSPVLVNDMYDWVDVIAGGFHSFGITSANQVFAWGKNTKGQLCEPGFPEPIVTVPTLVGSLPGTVSEIAAGMEHTLLLFETGDVYVAGSNDQYQGTMSSMTGLDQLFDFSGAQAIEAGPYSSAAIFSSNIIMKGQSFDGTMLSVPTVITE